MAKVLLGSDAQTKLQADFYANDGLMHVGSTACFPVISPDSGDVFFVKLVRPATDCSGHYQEVVKVTATDGALWTVERNQSQCYRVSMDFRMGDMVYYTASLANQIHAAIVGGAKLVGDVANDDAVESTGGMKKVTGSYQVRSGDCLLLMPCSAEKVLRFPVAPKEGDQFCAVSINAEMKIDTHGIPIIGSDGAPKVGTANDPLVWDFDCNKMICFVYDEDLAGWIMYQGGCCCGNGG